MSQTVNRFEPKYGAFADRAAHPTAERKWMPSSLRGNDWDDTPVAGSAANQVQLKGAPAAGRRLRRAAFPSRAAVPSNDVTRRENLRAEGDDPPPRVRFAIPHRQLDRLSPPGDVRHRHVGQPRERQFGGGRRPARLRAGHGRCIAAEVRQQRHQCLQSESLSPARELQSRPQRRPNSGIRSRPLQRALPSPRQLRGGPGGRVPSLGAVATQLDCRQRETGYLLMVVAPTMAS